jgi:succinate dehydrogenase/fumarate reductase flavoprotein subunit
MSILDAVREGRIAGLEAMRDKLATDMDDANPQVVAQIAARLQAVMSELAELQEPEGVSAFDDLARRRKDRIAATDDAASTRRRTRRSS